MHTVQITTSCQVGQFIFSPSFLQFALYLRWCTSEEMIFILMSNPSSLLLSQVLSYLSYVYTSESHNSNSLLTPNFSHHLPLSLSLFPFTSPLQYFLPAPTYTPLPLPAFPDCEPVPPLSQTEWPCQCWLEPAWPDALLGLAEACGKECCLF